MLVLRFQRVGRKKLAHFRLVAQEHSLSPKSGRVAARLGSFNPHSKEFIFDKAEVEKHLSNGAQPSNRVARLLKDNGVKLPSWVKISEKQSKPKKEPEEKPEQSKAEEKPAEAIEEPAADEEKADDKSAEEAPAEESAAEASEDEAPKE